MDLACTNLSVYIVLVIYMCFPACADGSFVLLLTVIRAIERQPEMCAKSMSGLCPYIR